jgi:hypothetical protein
MTKRILFKLWNVGCVATLLLMTSGAEARDLTDAKVREISEKVRTTMAGAGYDVGSSLKFRPDVEGGGYDRENDVIYLGRIQNFPQPIRQALRQATGGDDAAIMAGLTAHEFCHADLKRRGYSPALIAAKARCPAMSESPTDDLFEEVLCDITAIRVLGGRPAAAIVAIRQQAIAADSSPNRLLGARLTGRGAKLLPTSVLPKQDVSEAMARICEVASEIEIREASGRGATIDSKQPMRFSETR